MVVSTWLQDNDTHCEALDEVTEAMWAKVEEAERGEIQRMQRNLRKSTFPEYRTWQMADLQEISDESLHVYPEASVTEMRRDVEILFDQIHSVLGFLSQPQSLQWYSRRCVRENLVSLQPSVVKTLPVPSILKRYILCHEL